MSRLGDPFWRRFVNDPTKKFPGNVSANLSRSLGNASPATQYLPVSTPLNYSDWDAVERVSQGSIYHVYRNDSTAKQKIIPIPLIVNLDMQES